MTLEIMSEQPVGNGELFLYLDNEGIDILSAAIEKAKKSGHEHLLSKEWGGNSLSISSGSARSFHKLTIEFVS